MDFVAGNNPNLDCIEVDDEVESTNYWINIDSHSSYSNSCSNSCSNSTSVDEKSLKNTSIYPNPTVDLLTITSNDKIESIDIIDLSGRTVMKEQYQGSNINITQLKPGAYFLRVTAEDGRYETLQFIRQ
jgi:hypothetical protein